MVFRIGLVINPVAGIGGPLALKGSDGVTEQALAEGAKCLSNQRMAICLQNLENVKDNLQWFTAPGIMGSDCLLQNGFDVTTIGSLDKTKTQAEDTEAFAKALVKEQIDLLLFVGGDGTARNIVNVVDEHQLVLGIPAGVKMHSGVFAVSPQAAARLLQEFVAGKPISVSMEEVRDIDEALLREGRVNSKYYGELLVPNDNRYVQQVKNSGEVDDSAVQMEIAASVVDEMENDVFYVIGAGTTPQKVMDELGLPNTLLGVDVVRGRELIGCDVTAMDLQELITRHPYHTFKLVITVTGGQGYLIGRGNQQLSAEFLKHIDKENVIVMITPDKLSALAERPLLMDSGDSELDRSWSGWIPIVTGYQQRSVYPLVGY